MCRVKYCPDAFGSKPPLPSSGTPDRGSGRRHACLHVAYRAIRFTDHPYGKRPVRRSCQTDFHIGVEQDHVLHQVQGHPARDGCQRVWALGKHMPHERGQTSCKRCRRLSEPRSLSCSLSGLSRPRRRCRVAGILILPAQGDNGAGGGRPTRYVRSISHTNIRRGCRRILFPDRTAARPGPATGSCCRRTAHPSCPPAGWPAGRKPNAEEIRPSKTLCLLQGQNYFAAHAAVQFDRPARRRRKVTAVCRQFPGSFGHASKADIACEHLNYP